MCDIFVSMQALAVKKKREKKEVNQQSDQKPLTDFYITATHIAAAHHSYILMRLI